MSIGGTHNTRSSRLSPAELTRQMEAREGTAVSVVAESRTQLRRRPPAGRLPADDAQMLDKIVEGHARRAKVVVRMGDAAADLRRRLNITLSLFNATLQDPALETADITASFEKSTVPVTVDLRGADLHSAVHRRGEALVVNLNARGERLMLFEPGSNDDSHYRIAALASLVDADTIMPPPIFLPHVMIKQAARFGFARNVAYKGYLFEYPDGDWINMASVGEKPTFSAESAQHMLIELRRIIYGLRLKGIVPIERVAVFMNPAAGKVRIGSAADLYPLDVGAFGNEEPVDESLFVAGAPYVPNLLARLLQDSRKSFEAADRTIELADYKLMNLLGCMPEEEETSCETAAARLFARDLSAFMRMNPKSFTWARRSAQQIVDEFSAWCSPPRERDVARVLSAQLDDGTRHIDEPLDRAGATGALHTMISAHFPGLRYADFADEAVDYALDLIQAERLVDRNKLIAGVPSAEVFEPAVRALIDEGGIYMMSRTQWPRELVDVVRNNPYIPVNAGINWGYAAKLRQGIAECLRFESSGWLELKPFGYRSVSMPLGWSFGPRPLA